jgi:glutamate/aspartate transport system substrate-binding protein
MNRCPASPWRTPDDSQPFMDAGRGEGPASGGGAMKTIKHTFVTLFALWLQAAGTLAVAQLTDDEFTGTLKKARGTGTIAIGHRDASIPFSYVTGSGEPIGYSIDLCKLIVDAIGEQVGREIAIKWVPVTSETRIDAIVSGKADLECGSTTNNAERQKQVAFSPIIFVAGTKLLVKKGSPIKSFRDLPGKTVVVTAGTTNEKAMKDIQSRFKLDFKIEVGADHAQSFAMLTGGKVDAFATDDVLLYGFLAKEKLRSDYLVVGDFLSYDPYGIMYRKNDPQLKKLIDSTFYSLAQERELEHLYNRWFLRRLPSGDRLDIAISPQLETIFKAMATAPE